MNQGMFIVLEGGEGVGKSTQIAKLKEYLPTAFPDREFVFTREPGGSPFAEKIRDLIVGNDAKHANGRTMIGLLMASRADHVDTTILPALEAGKVVICDRYIASSYAYQVIAQESPELKDIFWAYAKLMPQSDLTILFDIDSAEAMARVEGRDAEKSHFDARAIDFHNRIRAGFKEYIEQSGVNSKSIDAGETVDVVWDSVRNAVISVL